LNELHETFSKALGRSSLEDLSQAKQKPGATLDTSSRGFFARNINVGRADYLIAFSAGSGSRPTDGGTAHTWRNSTTALNRRRHIPLQALQPTPTLFSARTKALSKAVSEPKSLQIGTKRKEPS
jgi:hypothetical protein